MPSNSKLSKSTKPKTAQNSVCIVSNKLQREKKKREERKKNVKEKLWSINAIAIQQSLNEKQQWRKKKNITLLKTTTTLRKNTNTMLFEARMLHTIGFNVKNFASLWDAFLFFFLTKKKNYLSKVALLCGEQFHFLHFDSHPYIWVGKKVCGLFQMKEYHQSKYTCYSSKLDNVWLRKSDYIESFILYNKIKPTTFFSSENKKNTLWLPCTLY